MKWKFPSNNKKRLKKKKKNVINIDSNTNQTFYIDNKVLASILLSRMIDFLNSQRCNPGNL